MSNEWLARGGAYYLLGIVTVGSAIFFGCIGIQAGKAARRENDGCLLSICNVVMAIVGAGLGFLPMMGRFPLFLLTSSLGAIALPGLSTWMFLRQARN